MDTNIRRIVQLQHPSGRRIALVDEPYLFLIGNISSAYNLALAAIDTKTSIIDMIDNMTTPSKLDYNEVYEGKSNWKLLPAFDHPSNMMSCLVSGTGLTHKNSAFNRQMMHQAVDEKPTDSMQMYQWGVEGGNPPDGKIGVQPEWFYKGSGSVLKGHGDFLEAPTYALDGGEEPEIAGAYIIDRNGNPHRIGFCTGNEFSDHVMEKKNYLYLAPSKLRQCAIGPELVIGKDFAEFMGTVSVRRDNETLWESSIHSGEKNMAHNLVNLEYHHFKYEGHRIPLQGHIHFFGADAFSFGNKIILQQDDEMIVEWNDMGRPLKNYLKVDDGKEKLIPVKSC
jgi:hypothetical protein